MPARVTSQHYGCAVSPRSPSNEEARVSVLEMMRMLRIRGARRQPAESAPRQEDERTTFEEMFKFDAARLGLSPGDYERLVSDRRSRLIDGREQ